MAKYHNIEETKKVGKNIAQLRKDAGFSVDDIADMTGFAQSTITAIENGAETNTSHLIEIAKAIGVSPKELFNIEFEIMPRFAISPNRENRELVTSRVRKLLVDGYFKNHRLVSEIIQALKEQYNISPDPTIVSTIMRRLCSEKHVTYSKSGRKNLYVEIKK